MREVHDATIGKVKLGNVDRVEIGTFNRIDLDGIVIEQQERRTG